ncbi:MAG: hypothetical protein R3253_15495, partial [Longimicrobiales bacterium]|nr:hypothetical protein [Longimicrobiales bacterium]
LEVDNLQGSRGDSLDTAEHFEIYGIGVQVTLNAPVELLDVRTTGAVDILGQPSFEHSRFGGLQIQESATGSRITGCTGPAFWNIAYRMCDPEGFTGAVRIDFQVADTTWSLLDKAARLNVTMRPGGSVSCPSGSRVCFVVR